MKKKQLNPVNKEYKRLSTLFKSIDASKAKLVDELLKKAAFLKVELDKLESIISLSYVVQTSNKGNQRVNLAYKTYLQSLSTYQSIIKTLNTILGRDIDDGDDYFDEFLKEVNK
ncbi:MAG: hypothetical protein WCX96_04255 [Bacilli bacterium]